LYFVARLHVSDEGPLDGLAEHSEQATIRAQEVAVLVELSQATPNGLRGVAVVHELRLHHEYAY
jgi:hypothetical protein